MHARLVEVRKCFSLSKSCCRVSKQKHGYTVHTKALALLGLQQSHNLRFDGLFVLFNNGLRCRSLCQEELDVTVFDTVVHQREHDKETIALYRPELLLKCKHPRRVFLQQQDSIGY
jgi:hypothetical protein